MSDLDPHAIQGGDRRRPHPPANPARLGSCRARRSLPRIAGAAVLMLALAGSAPVSAAARSGAWDPREGEALLAQAPSSARTKALSAWLKGASLDPLLRLLRLDATRLGPDEGAIAEAAFRLAPRASSDLRRRLAARMQLALAESGRRTERDPADLRMLRPRQSVWRVGVLLPDRGDYAGYAVSVREALAAGIASGAPGEPFVLEEHGTGDSEPARAAAALDTAAATCGVIVGELLSEATFALAAGTRIAALPLVSPTATDEAIGTAGPQVFQVGPASQRRGEALARAVLGEKFRKVAIFTSSAVARGALVTAFAAAAESLGATIVRRDVYPPGGGDFRAFARGMRTFGADVLFWDGDTREAVTLLRQLGAEGVSVRVCGGTALAPDQFHAGEKVLLEGVTYVADDWRLAPAQQAIVDSLAAARGEHAGALWTRGFLSGRRIAAAVAAGARTPAEMSARLASRDPELRAHGFLDVSAEGATLPVWTIQRGRAVEIATP